MLELQVAHCTSVVFPTGSGDLDLSSRHAYVEVTLTTAPSLQLPFFHLHFIYLLCVGRVHVTAYAWTGFETLFSGPRVVWAVGIRLRSLDLAACRAVSWLFIPGWSFICCILLIDTRTGSSRVCLLTDPYKLGNSFSVG